MGKGAAPTPPSAKALAGAQTSSNIATAVGNQQLNAVNQSGPTGSVSYTNSGTYDYTDPTTGKTFKLPKLTQTTTLNPAEQAVYDANAAARGNVAQTAQSQSAALNDILSQPLDLSNGATEARLNELALKRLNPQIDQNRASLETRLANQGIKLGSAAYDRAMSNFGQQENDARNQLILTGHNTAVNDALLQRSTPLNEVMALLNGGQVQGPSTPSAPQSALAGTDVAGLMMDDYKTKAAQYQQQQSDMLGGLFGIGKAVLGIPSVGTGIGKLFGLG